MTQQQTVHCTCSDCAHTFAAQVPVGASVDDWSKSVLAIRCPACGAGHEKVMLGAETPTGFKISSDAATDGEGA